MLLRSGLRPAALTGLAMLSACAVGPHYTPPTPPQAHAFVNAQLLPARTVEDPNPALDSWWVAFNDAELTSLIHRALTQNLDLAQADARLTQARAQAKAAGAALAPAGQLNGQAEYESQSLESPSARTEEAFPGFRRYQKLYDVGIGASWEPDLFGGLRRAAQAARAQYEASEAAHAAARIAVVAETADQYLQVRALQAQLATTLEAATIQDRLTALTRLQYEHGIVARSQFDQSEAAREAAKAPILALRSGLEAATVALEVLTGATPGSLHAELAQPSGIPRAPRLEAIGGPASLLRRRPDLIAAERTLAASNARIGAAIADYYPKVTLSGVLGYEASDIGQLAGPATFQPQGIVGVRWRLFDFGRVDAEVAAARGARAEALAAYRLSVLKATGDVETALAALAHNQDQALALTASETALCRARDAVQASRDAGRASMAEVLEANARVLEQRDQRIVAEVSASRAAVSVFRALGGGWTS